LFYILYGEDEFSIKETLDRIKTECGGREFGEANTTVLEGGKFTLNELIAACNTMPFLAPKRLVVVEGLLGRFESKEKRRGRRTQIPEVKEWDALTQHIDDMPDSTVLVLVDGKLTKANTMLRKFSAKAIVREFTPPKGGELQNWVRSRVSSRGGTFSFSAERLLIDFIGGNLWILSNEIDKLCLYAGEQRIEEDDINMLVSYAREANVFTMVDAIVQHRLGIASRLLHQLLDGGSAPPYLLYMITRQFRLLIQAKQLMAQRLAIKTIGNKIGLTSEFVLEKTLEQAREYTMKRLEEAYRKLLATDISIKTGALSGELALDLLVTELCGDRPSMTET